MGGAVPVLLLYVCALCVDDVAQGCYLKKQPAFVDERDFAISRVKEYYVLHNTCVVLATLDGVGGGSFDT